jgi:hypothetical protein
MTLKPMKYSKYEQTQLPDSLANIMNMMHVIKSIYIVVTVIITPDATSYRYICNIILPIVEAKL